MSAQEEIAQAFQAIREQIESAAQSPLIAEGLWTGDFRAALPVAARFLFSVDDPDAEQKLVARAARIADLMQAERKARRVTAGTETTQ